MNLFCKKDASVKKKVSFCKFVHTLLIYLSLLVYSRAKSNESVKFFTHYRSMKEANQ